MSLPFCADPFFNLNLTWYTNATNWYSLNASASVGPDLTECFKDTLVRWLPLGWLFVALLLGLPCLLRARRPAHLVDVPLNWLQALKLVLAVGFLGVAIADIIYSAAVSSWFWMSSVVLILAPALEAFMMVLAVLFYALEYQKLNFANPAFIAFWLFESVAYLVLSYTASLNLGTNTNRVLPTHAALIYARWIIAVISFILCCLSPLNNLPGGSKPYAAERCQVVEVTTPADAKKCCGCCSRKRNDSDRAAAYKDSNPVVGALNEPPLAGPKKVKTMKIRAPCPEEFVSHASYLSYMWLLPLVIRGFWKALETSDLWLLRKEETVDFNRNVFAPRWEPVLAQWREEQAALEAKKKQNAPPETATNPRVDATNPEANGKRTPSPQQSAEKTKEDEKKEKEEAEKKKKKEEENKPKPPLMMMLMKVYGPMLMVSQLINLIYVVALFCNPLLLWVFIEFMAQTSIELWKGYTIAVLYFVVQFVQSISYQLHFHIVIKVSIRMRAALIDTLYRKTLSVAPSAMLTSGTGDFVNFLAVDLQRLQDMLQYVYMIWFAPINTVFAIVLLWFQIGWITFVGLGMMFGCIIFNFVLASGLRVIMMKMMTAKDKRVRFMNELLNGIKVVKLYAWEKAFMKVISDYRMGEILMYIRFYLINAFIMVLFMVMPFMLTAGTFLIYLAVHGNDLDNQLTAVSLFMTMSLYGTLQVPLGFLPMLINFLSAAAIGINRVAAFLAFPDADPESVLHVENEETKTHPIIIENGDFSWKEDGEVVLRNINLKVKKGELVAIVGAVGCGKSSLVAALLGQLVKMNGCVNVLNKKIAYVAQSAWIQNTSLKNNIIFGIPLDEKRYEDTLDACALTSDLKVLPGGDSTEIGERGINLSGGQKQRVAVARAVYSDADLFILDDPLSAVDVHVGKHLFDRVFGPDGMLAKRNVTRVLITHGIHYLPKVDRIICLADKTISEQGTFDELLQQGGHFAQLIAQFQNEAEEQEKEQEKDAEAPAEEHSSSNASNDPNSPDTENLDAHKTDGYEDNGTAPKVSFAGGSDSPAQSQPLQVQFSVEELEARDRAASTGSNRRLSSAAHAKPVVPKPSPDKAKLMTEEDSATGHVTLDVYWWYIRAMTIVLVFIFFAFFVAYEGLSVFAAIWLSDMADNEDMIADFLIAYKDMYIINILNGSYNNAPNVAKPTIQTQLNWFKDNQTAALNDAANIRRYYLWWYLGFGCMMAGLVLGFSVTFTFMVASASRFIHSAMLDRLLHAPMSFFDTTPTGRILNRFTKDLDLIDFMMPITFRGFIMMLGQIVMVFVVIAYSTPLFLAVLGPVVIIFIVVLILYLPTSRQLRRLESVTRSPVFSHVAETIQGRTTIHAFQETDRFIEDQAKLMDENHVYNLASFISYRFLGVCIDFADNILVVAACAFSVYGRDNSSALGAGKAALSLSYAIQISQIANMMVRMMNDFEVNAVAIERTKEYTKIPQEAPWEIEATAPPPKWPEQGVIQLQDYSTRYREGLDLVLKNVSLNIKSTEKVGICGRTGAGKSSVTLALFRLIEASSGKIVIDGHAAESLGLHQLRGRLTILPQEPVIFSQTLRFNLDPFDEHTDEAVWRSLELVHLKEHFSAPDEKSGKAKGLGFAVTEGGGNLSVGQRQLLCLARALLRRTKVLVLDEATAAVDYETDALIQATIRSEFKECTVLTIAHRINTILDSDKILVLERGRVREFDSPQNLLARGDSSTFFQMVQQAGSLNAALASSTNNIQ